MRVAIIGAGNNADYHVRFSQAYRGARLVGIADRDITRAQEYVRNYGIDRAYASTAELLNDARPDVVHVVTPPRTHFAIVQEVLEAGCHVVVEKPLTLNADEARALYAIAERRGVTICPVHNHLFDPCMREADALIKSGKLGQVINVESYYGLNTNIPPFRDYPEPNVLPWLYGLPGGVYQDFLPHPLYALLEYTGAPRSITVKHRTTGVLPQSLPDEIRVLVDGERAMGTVTVSFAARPHLHFIRVYGTEGMVEVDINTMTTTLHALSGLPKAATKATYNLDDARQKTKRTFSNVWQFVTGKLKPYHGMMTLIHSYYDAIKSGAPVPVSKDSALAVVSAMDDIFAQMQYPPLNHENIVSARSAAVSAKRALVTGGTGFVGKALVRRLIDEGYAVRVLARKLSRVQPIVDLGAEVFWGDVADMTSFESAMRGCDVVIHLAAGTSGSERDSQTGTLQGTRNLIELCGRHKPQRLVYISSCSVYGIVSARKHAVIAEDAALEASPELRGSYSASKQEAETYVTQFASTGGVPTVVLRPGTIYGPGGELYTPLIGFSMGSQYIVLGSGRAVLPFVHVDNLVDAIVQAAERREAAGEVFNVVDPDTLTKRDYMDRVIRGVHPGARVAYLPLGILYGITWMQEIAFGLMKRRPVLTRYRLMSSQKRVTYSAAKIAARLGWVPRLRLPEALNQLVAAELRKRNERHGTEHAAAVAGDSAVRASDLAGA